MKALTYRLGLICLFGILVATAGAQPPMKGGRNFPDPDRPHRGDQDEISANIENLRMLKLLETIDLSEEQATKFIPIFHGFRKDFEDIRHERDSLIDKTMDALRDGSSDREINRLLAEMEKNREDMEARRLEFLEDCDTILTVPQKARLIIFQERFERDMLKALHDFRQQRRMHSNPDKQGNNK